MESGIQMFTTDSVSTISSGKIVAQTSTFEQTSMTDDDPGIRIIGDNKVELVYKNKVTNEEASIDLYNSNNSSNNAKLYIDNPRGTTSLIIDQNRRLGVGNIVPEAILHLHNHNNSNSEHIRVTNNDNLGMNMILTSSNTDIKANFGIRWYNSGSTTLVNNALVIRNLNGTNTIGIGTSTPLYTLDVSGNINFTGTLTQNGSTYTGSYTLPIASSSTLGGIKIGNNLSINGSGVVSATDTNTTYSVGDGGLTQNNFTNTLKTKLDGIASSANNYSLPAATSSSLGGIKVGTNLSIDSGTGVLSATDTNTTYSVGDGGLTQNNFTNTLKTKLDGIATSANNYTLPTAASDTLGGVKVGTNLSISSGVLSATDTNTTYSVGDGGLTQNNFTNALKTKLDGIATSANNYTLPTASSSTLGGIKVGTNLSISSGVLSATDTNTTYSVGDGGLTQNNFTNALKTKLDSLSTLPTASSSTLGGIKVGTNLSISSGILSATDTNTTYSVGDGGLTQNNFTNALKTKLDSLSTLPTASSSTLGGVKVDGSTITINGSGVISSSGGSSAWTTSGSNIYRSSGRVGIGTTSPSTALHIYTIDGSENTGSRHQINYNGGASGSGGSGNLSLRVRGRSWFEDYTFHSSDSRIKKEIEDIPDKLALEQVRNIPCRYYKYVDTYGKGDSRTIGFIAQEVNSVLPMAVSIKTGIIPNVYTNILDVIWEEITETNTETGIEIKKYKMRTSTITPISGVKYKFYVSNTENDEVEKIVTGSSDNTFTFEQQWTNVFCYGREVEDFHTVDKNKLFALNFSATQEIDRIQQQELTKVKDLEIENFLLKERVKDLESKMNDVLNRLVQLENNSH